MPLELDKAKEQEKKWNWREAAKSYEKMLRSERIDVSHVAEIWERVGFCYSRASTQCTELPEFTELRNSAVKAYKNAAQFYKKGKKTSSQGQSARCDTIAELLHSWLASDSMERRKILDVCLSVGKKSLDLFENSGEQLSYAEMCTEMLQCLHERLALASDWEKVRKIAEAGIEYAEKAISVLSKHGTRDMLLRTYSLASLQSWYAYGIMPERKELMQRSLTYSEKALRLCKDVGNPYYTAMANWAASLSRLLFTEEAELALEHAKEMLKQGTIVRDNYLKGVASYLIAFVNNWIALREEDPNKKRKRREEIVKHSESAIRYLEPIIQDFYLALTYQFYTENYSSLARDLAASLEEKRGWLKKAVKVGRQGLKHAMHSGSPDATAAVLHALSKALHFYSNLENSRDKKIKLLDEALTHREKYINVVEGAFPSNDWIQGVGKSYEGLIRADLARMEKNKGKKKLLLEEAINKMEEGISHCRKWILPRPVPTLLAVVARFEDWLSEILKELYSITKNGKVLIKANEFIYEAANKFKKVNLPSRVAESYWKIAKNLDHLNKYQQSAENFDKAHKAYKSAAQKAPNFTDFYLDYATYMRAWSEIEKAKSAHNAKEYATSMKCYQNTAIKLAQSKMWGYLSSNFSAWAVLEKAEDLSRNEKNVKSTEAFQKAAKLFRESERDIQARAKKIENADEKNLAERLIKVSETRQKYCYGRIAVEEARLLDKEGAHVRSSDEFRSAAETFQEIAEGESEQTQAELRPLIYLCQAWEKMMTAEARASPQMYGEAAELFLQAKKYTSDQPTSLLTLAHSSFCRALEAGTEFEISKDPEKYQQAKRQLATAGSYYLKAGFEAASVYAAATQRLFDAYVFMDNAKKEMDPEKEVKFYVMAERMMEISAESYSIAKHPEKTQQVRQLLRKVREDREIAISLSAILHAPTTTSSTASFVTLAPHEEIAVGLDRFEHADIQGKLIQHVREIRSGEEFDLEIHLMNVGKEAVMLSKLEGIVPGGFKLVTKPDYCHLDDGTLDMKGKQLDPLKAEEIRLVLEPFGKGTLEIAPKILFMDEQGRQVVRGLEPITINVQESVLPGRITTGYDDLDGLLFGGIPENYTVILTSPSCDEKDLLVKRFLEAGVKRGETIFYITIEVRGIRELIGKNQSNFHLFVCNPRADTMVQDLPNVIKLKGVENLTEIEIALISSFRKLGPPSGPRRACIEIISDVLLQHHAITTRTWLAGLIPELRSRSFSTLAIINPLMHPPEEVHAILGLFEGEINIYEKETSKGPEKFIRVKKMVNQKYLRNERPLIKERMEAKRTHENAHI